MFVLAHLSDTHIAPLPRVALGDVFGLRKIKRLTGLASWKLSRRSIHRREVLDALRRDLVEQAPDHVVLTGDLVNISLPEEFSSAREWLQAFGKPDWISVIPGNHDAYVHVPWDRSLGQWQAYMSDERAGTGPGGGPARARFPYVRRRGDILIAGLSSAVVTPPFYASGRLGPDQLDRLRVILEQAAGERPAPLRVVLVHHPPLTGLNTARKALEDAAAFEAVMRRTGAGLILHGHNHRDMVTWFNGAAGPIPVVGVASASAGIVHHGRPLARYNLYRIARKANKWSIQVTERGLDQPPGAFKTIRRYPLAGPGAG